MHTAVHKSEEIKEMRGETRGGGARAGDFLSKSKTPHGNDPVTQEERNLHCRHKPSEGLVQKLKKMREVEELAEGNKKG